MSPPTEAVGYRPSEIVARALDLIRRKPWFARLLSGLALFAFYYATAPGNRTEADDAFWYACLVRQAPLGSQVAGQHSSHLLYLPLMTSIYRLAQDAGITLSSYDLLRLISSIAAAATGVLFYLLLRERLGVGFHASLAATTGLCVSYGFWRYANEAEVYAPAAALIVLGLWLALGANTRLRLAGVVLTFTVATFVSILSLIPALVVVPFLVAPRMGFRNAAVYVASLSLLVAAIAYGAYLRADHGTSSFVAFLKGPPPSSDWTHGAAQSVVGFGQSLIAGNFLLTHTAVLDALQERYVKVFSEERFLAAHTSPWLGFVPFATLASLFVAFALLGFVLLRNPRRSAPRPRLLALLVTWIVAYWLVVLRVEPIAPEAWTLLLIPIWIVVATTVFDRVDKVRPGLVWLFVGALFLHNLLGGMLLMHGVSTDFNARKAAWLVANARPEDVILTAAGSVFPRYLAYQSHARVISLYGAYTSSDVEQYYHLALTTPGHVYITGDVFHPPSYIRIANPVLNAALRRLSADLRDNVSEARSDAFGGVYLVSRPDSPPYTSGTLQGIDPCDSTIS